jgi:hypothetical protein
MRTPVVLSTSARAAILLNLVLGVAVTGCADRARDDRPDRTTASGTEALGGEVPDADPAPPKVDACALLTDEEISEQLWLTLQPSERESYKPRGFDVSKADVPWGISRRCELGFRSKATIGDGPALRGTFIVMVSHASAVPVPERQKKPIPGVGDEAYRHEQTWYVRVGDLVASITDFRGTNEPGLEPESGRVALLKHIAGRLR